MLEGSNYVVEEGGENVEEQRRAATRAKNKEVKTVEREANVGATGPYNRGVSIQDKLSCATLAHTELQADLRNVRELLTIANLEEANVIKNLELVYKMYEKADSAREKDMLGKRKLSLIVKLDEIDDRKMALQTESDRLMEQCKKRPATSQALYDAVGNFGSDVSKPPAKKACYTSPVPNDVSFSKSGADTACSALSRHSSSTPTLSSNGEAASKSIQEILDMQVSQDDDNNKLLAGMTEQGSNNSQGGSGVISDSQEPSASQEQSASYVCPVEARLSENSKRMLQQYRDAQTGNYPGGPNFDAHAYYGCYD